MRYIIAAATLVLVATLANTSHAVGWYKFCADWAYRYGDAGCGTDYLTHNHSTYGTRKATHTWAVLYVDGWLTWSGYLDWQGCAPSVPSYTGTYTFAILPALGPSPSIWIFDDEDEDWQWFVWYDSLPGRASGGQTFRLAQGWDFAPSVAAAMTLLLDRADVPSGHYKVYPYHDCPGSTGGSCYDPATGIVHLGRAVGAYAAGGYSKAVIGHEMGHAVAEKLFGRFDMDYDSDMGTDKWCRCDHLSRSAWHCLQSREDVQVAQSEGFSHFYATDLFNNPSHTVAWFPYCKEWHYDGQGHGYPPPNKVQAYASGSRWFWLKNHCLEFDRGVELDWLGFYYELHNKTSNKFSLYQIGDVYREACNGWCNELDVVHWDNLLIATTALYGWYGSKAVYWRDLGSWYGVDYWTE
jgi:hypothetical protein